MSELFEQRKLIDRETLKALLPVFMREIEGLRDQLKNDEVRSNPDAAKKTVHQLRGVAGSFGATLIHEQSSDIEEGMSQGEISSNELGQKLDELCETVSKTLEYVKAEYL